MSTGEVDIGALLRRLGVAEDIDGRADALQVELVGRGSRLSELTARSSFEARLLGGSLAVRGPGKQPSIAIKLKEAVLAAPAGKRIAARLDGALDETPVEILVWSGTLADFARDASKVPFTVDAKAAGARLTLEGEVALPLGRGGQLTLEMRGERLDALSGLARVALPPWGPWSIRGPFQMTPTGYEVRRLQVRVGTSRLNGTGRLDVTGARPRLDVRITAPNVQLDDFPYPRGARRRAVQADDAGGPARDGAGGGDADPGAAQRGVPAPARRVPRRGGAAGPLGQRPARRRQARRADRRGAALPRPGRGQPARRHREAVDPVRPDQGRDRARRGGLYRALRLRHPGAPPAPRGRRQRPLQPEPRAFGHGAVARHDHAPGQRADRLRHLADRRARGRLRPVVGERHARAAAVHRPERRNRA